MYTIIFFGRFSAAKCSFDTIIIKKYILLKNINGFNFLQSIELCKISK